MNYTLEQISQIVLKVLKEVETPDILGLSNEEKIELAENPNTSQETLAILATDKSPYVRNLVAENLNTSQETLAILATDKSPYVRWLRLFATDMYLYVRWRVAKNPKHITRISSNSCD